MFVLASRQASLLRTFVGSLDVAQLEVAELRELLSSFSAIEKIAATGKILVATKLAEDRQLATPADRSDAHVLANVAGMSVSGAKAALEAGRRLTSQPDVAQAARAGELSELQLRAVARAVEANPNASRRLLDVAPLSNLSELKAECALAISEVEDAETRRRRFHEMRYLKAFADDEGMRHLEAGGSTEMMAMIEAALEERSSAMLKAAEHQGVRLSRAACRFDALFELATQTPGVGDPSGSPGRRHKGSDVKIIVRVDHAALIRGSVGTGETCDIAGVGPIAVSAVREMIEQGDPFLAAILTKGVEIAKVVHLGRRPNAFQRTALQYLYPTCAVRNCRQAAFLEYDHEVDFAENSVTKLSNIRRLCWHHHMLKTRFNFELVDGVFVSPDDPSLSEVERRRGPPG
jgi:hypothetical protein